MSNDFYLITSDVWGLFWTLLLTLKSDAIYGRSLRDHPYITSAKELGEWVWTMTIFADVQYYIFADILGGSVGRKKSTNMLT